MKSSVSKYIPLKGEDGRVLISVKNVEPEWKRALQKHAEASKTSLNKLMLAIIQDFLARNKK